MKKAVLLVTAGLFHPPLAGRWALRRALGRLDGFAFIPASTLEALPRLRMENYRALVLYIHQKAISDAALAALDRFVRNGGGLLAVHSATASFKDTSHYFDILGGRFTGHGPVGPMAFEPAGGVGPPFEGIPGFQIRDELYIHDLQPGIQVQFQARKDGQAVPVVWTHRYGQGRVCYVCPGHRAASLRHPSVQEILRRGLTWVCD